MTPVTDEGRAHLEAVRAERDAKRETLIAEQRAEGLADLDIGSFVWAKGLDGQEPGGGLVVDADEGGVIGLVGAMSAHGWVVQARRVESSRSSSRMLVAVRRISLDAIEVAEPRTGRALAEYAKAAWLSAGVTTGDVTNAELELARYGDWLAHTATGRARSA